MQAVDCCGDKKELENHEINIDCLFLTKSFAWLSNISR